MVQLLPSNVCAVLYLFKKKVANPHPLKKISQNIIKIKKSFWNFLIFWEWEGVGRRWSGGRGNFIHSNNSFKT